MIRALRTVRAPVVVAAVVVFGCGPTRYDVSGRVAYDDGQPFAGGGLVVLEGTVDGRAVMARGAIGSDGRFAMSAGMPGQGVLPGSYRVRLIPPPTIDVDGPAAKLPYDEKFLDCDRSGVALDVGGGMSDLVISLGPRT